MTFREFKTERHNIPVGEKKLSMKLLEAVGLDRDYYARALFNMAVKGQLDEQQLEAWLSRARDPRKRATVKAEIGATQQAAETPPTPQAPRVRKRKKQATYEMLSRSDHGRARKAAAALGLDLRSAEGGRFQLTATGKQASELTLTGFWMTVDD